MKPHRETHRAERAGWLRAAVLGANDGIVSTASLVLGVAASDATPSAVVTAGLAGLVGGALSMAAGEYVSVSSQRDVEQADLARERRELREQPEHELEELTLIYANMGLDRALAERVAQALTKNGDPLRVHAREELGLDPDDLAEPTRAALVSALSFALGAALPLSVMALAPAALRTTLTLSSGLATLALLGGTSAWLGGAAIPRAVARVLVGGALAMGLTFALGAWFGTML
ncbi:MAG: VIT family protein [Myxococcales bacterium]|nr:VIT family protein [Myxococcales bacterium]MCB9626150.1 VIT family protein [Sandaracinaceae bacterium]